MAKGKKNNRPKTTRTPNSKEFQVKLKRYVPEDPMPERSHKLWPKFERFVKSGKVVRKDLLDGGRDHWELIWKTFAAGARTRE